MKQQPTKQIWIEKGYELFALYGPSHLSINKISKELVLSRASFYHHFGDIDCFIEEVLNFHIQMASTFDAKCKTDCHHFFPDLYVLLSAAKIPLCFSRQIFINRHIPIYNQTFMSVFTASSDAFALALFAEQFNLALHEQKTFDLWLTVCESWYSRIDPKDFSSETLQRQGKEVLASVLPFFPVQ